VRDAVDEIVKELRAVRRLLGDTDLSGGGDDVDLTSVKTPRHALTAGSYVVAESADMKWANADGTVTVEPGDEVPLVRYDVEADAGMLLAVGATDEQDVRYRVEVDDNRTVGGKTESPLGVLNDPFSFVDKLGGAIPASRTLIYYAELDASASASVDLAARIHVEEVPDA